MRNLKMFFVGLLLVVPLVAVADASDVPEDSTWYLHVDLERIRTEDEGRGVYEWLSDEVFDEIKDESGADIGREVGQLTAFSLQDQGPVFLIDGEFSQVSKDRLMTFIAAEGDIRPSKSSGKKYYRLTGNGDDDDSRVAIDNGNIEVQFESLEDESWVSTALDNRILITSTETQMKQLLASDGKIGSDRNHGGAMLVLTAEKTLLQAGMNSDALGSDDSSWDSNILRNTEQMAFLVAAKAGMLALEATLVASDPDIAQSLASVVRGLISLLSFSDDMEDEVVAVLQGTNVEADGSNLSISLAIDPDMVATTLGN